MYPISLDNMAFTIHKNNKHLHMKIKQIIIAGTLLVSVVAFAQKDELKALKKIYGRESVDADDFSIYRINLSKLESLATEESDKIAFNFYKCITPFVQLKSLGENATNLQMDQILSPKAINEMAIGFSNTLDYEQKVGKKVFTDDINKLIPAMKPNMLNIVIHLSDAKMFKEASELLYSIYLLDKNDQEKLYYAANYAVNAKDYDKALEYYNQLKKLNYSGEGTVYWAVNKASGKEESFPTVAQREQFIQVGTHEKPRNEKLESKRGEIYTNIALILVNKDRTNEAIAAVEEARKENPTDDSLLITEAELYLKLNDTANYTKLVNEALAKDPNNAELNFNLGVISATANKLDVSEKYYMRALEIDPNYFNANLNLAELKLRADEKWVTEMNKLGVSEKDNKRYAVIKTEREKNFKTVLPYLEKAVELDGTNEAAKKTLLSVYNALDMTDKYKALKAKQ